jgi:hypothetical protein
VRSSRKVRVIALVALLVVLPIATQVAQRRFPGQAVARGVAAVACLFVYVTIAARLRSRVIGCVLAGVLIWAVTDSSATPREESNGRLFMCGVVGFLGGLLLEGIHRGNWPDSRKTGLGSRSDERTMDQANHAA